LGLHISEDTHDPGAVPKSVISKVVQGFPQTLTFDREEETEPIHITRIPDEVLLYILRFLDHGTIEHFASISRKARVLTLDSTIWR
jgi:F-box protein 9